jgi:hypothetical protein
MNGYKGHLICQIHIERQKTQDAVDYAEPQEHVRISGNILVRIEHGKIREAFFTGKKTEPVLRQKHRQPAVPAVAEHPVIPYDVAEKQKLKDYDKGGSQIVRHCPFEFRFADRSHLL